MFFVRKGRKHIGWVNSDFQISAFIIKNCHTADEAYRVLNQLKADRELAIKTTDAGRKKQQAKIIRAQRILDNSGDVADKLDAESILMEAEAFEEDHIKCYNAALHEIEFIDYCLVQIEPLRKYSHLTDAMAAQICQKEEWKYELITRAKDYLLTTGTIPTDHYRTMRLHPDYQEEIAPIISEATHMIRSGKVSLINADTVHQLGKSPMEGVLLLN